MTLTKKIGLGIIGGLLVLVLYPAINMGLFYGPWPWEHPKEQNRVQHPEGFSIIAPRGWKHRICLQTDTLFPQDMIGLIPNTKARLHPLVHALKFRQQPNIEEMKKLPGYSAGRFSNGKFEGSDAYIYEGNAGKFWEWKAIFARGSNWYEVAIMVPSDNEAEDHVSGIWWPYLNTFHVDK